MTEQSDLGTIKGGGIGVLITQDMARFALMVVFFAKDCLALDTSSYCGGFRSLASCECGLAPDVDAVKEHNKSVLTILAALLKSVHFQIIKLGFFSMQKTESNVVVFKAAITIKACGCVTNQVGPRVRYFDGDSHRVLFRAESMGIFTIRKLERDNSVSLMYCPELAA